MSLTTIDGLDPDAPKRVGRPPQYSQKVADQICRLIAEGYSVRSIVKREGMPSEWLIYQWLRENRGGFQKQYADAKEIQALRLGDELIDIADDSTNDYMDRLNQEGESERVFDTEHYMRSRLRVDTRKWYLSKVLPKIYGDKIQHEHTGDVNVTIKNASEDELRARLAALTARVAARVTDVEDEGDGEAKDTDGG